MSHRTSHRAFTLLILLSLLVVAIPVAVAAPGNTTYHSLAGGSFSQNWSDTSLISTNDSWTNVPSIDGFRGDSLTSSTDVDPQTVLDGDDPGVLDVNANQTNPNTYTTGGVAEFEIADAVVALQGSGTADAPYLRLYLDTTGYESIQVSYKVRDIDGSSDNAVQQVALHYRVGTSGNFTNVPAAYIADATTGPSLATLVTPVNVTLPASVDNQPQVQIRILTTNAAGSDEWVGIDDITISGTPIAGDVAPSVASTVPANNATAVALNADITVTFSEPVDVTGAWFDITCTSSGSHTAAVSGGPTVFTLNPDVDFLAGETCIGTIYAAQVTDQDSDDPPDNMVADYVWSFATVAGITKIHDIQGSGSSSVAGTFTVEAIVTGDFQGVTGVNDFKLDGFFIQEENLDADANPATSEGIFVYCDTCPTNVEVGDKVQVTGPSSEYFGMSQLNATTAGAITVVSGGNALPTPAPVTLPIPGVTGPTLATAQSQINAYYEPFEGMLVQIGAQLSVTEYFELFRYGQLVLAEGGRFRQFTDVALPSAAGYEAHQIDQLRRTVILDDDSNQQNHALMENPDIAVYHPVPGFSTTNYVRGGDTITNLTGILHWSFAGLTGTDAWRIRPVPSQFSYAFTPGNLRTAAPTVPGNVKVASFNVLNYFTTIDNGSNGARGADSAAEFTRQADKIVAALMGLDADVIGVMEIENNGTAIADLVTKLNAAAGAGIYAYVNTGVVGTDAITAGIIYKPDKVTPVGAVQVLSASAFTDPNSTGTQRSRPAVAQTFEENTWGERFTVVVNHFKSKGSCPASGLDNDQNDGQGCWNDTRQKGADYLVNTWLAGDPTGSGDPDVLIIGDLNSYRKENPITNITAAGYTDQINASLGAAGYGYVFDGQLGYLDHALSSPGLTPQVAGLSEWHINADEVNLLDYNDDILDSGEQSFEEEPDALPLYEPNAYRSSDHDPVLVGLGLYADQSDLPATYGVAWHTGQGVPWRLGTTWTGEASSGTGTDSDDGVTRNYSDSWNDGQGEIYVTVTGPVSQWACLNAWLDYSDGSAVAGVPELPDNLFNANEHVVNNLAMQAGSNQLVTFALPAGVINSAAEYNMRFRLVPDPNNDGACGDVTATHQPEGGAQPTGRADGGEVEDYTFNPGPLAVTLASFDAQSQSDHVLVSWETVSETGNAGFNLYRADNATAPQTLLAFVPSQAPGSTQGYSYAWQDGEVVAGQTYWYWLEDIALNGATTLHGPVSVTFQTPTAVALASMEAEAATPTAAFPLLLALLAGCGALLLAAATRHRAVR